jgi:hypothetical protein
VNTQCSEFPDFTSAGVTEKLYVNVWATALTQERPSNNHSPIFIMAPHNETAIYTATLRRSMVYFKKSEPEFSSTRSNSKDVLGG